MDTVRSPRSLAAARHFLETPLDDLLSGPTTAESAALAVFRGACAQVPAYLEWLKEQGVDPVEIRTPTDFHTLPLITKENYFPRYPLGALCRGGLQACEMVAVSSGSSGEPRFWPRSAADEYAVAARFEQVFFDSFQADQQRTLAVVCFALGTWVGGIYTANGLRHLAAKGYPLTVITPGSNLAEILRVLTKFAPAFEQTVLLGYPPFLKDLLDNALAAGIDLTGLRLKLVLAGEPFSEDWRDRMAERMGCNDPRYSFASLYGTADGGVLAQETPLSIEIRRYLATHRQTAQDLFGETRLPTLAQYDPCSRYLEAQEGSLIFTADGVLPLVRYHIADHGGILSFAAMLEFLRRRGHDPLAVLKGGSGVREQPFVYVFGRGLFAVSYFGANIFPEHIAPALERPPICAAVTGKFVMEVVETEQLDAQLCIAVELAQGVAPDAALSLNIGAAIETELLSLNSEYAHYVPARFRRPCITLYLKGHPDYFPAGVKHRYTRGS